MVLKMAQPWQDPKSGIFYLRVRVPSDLLRKVKGESICLPVDDGMTQTKVGDVVKLSLRTREPREAKTRFAAAHAALNSYWDAVRKGPRALSHKEAVALSGEVYHAFEKSFHDNPGAYEQWANVLDDNEAARSGDYGRTKLMIGELGKVKYAMEARFGAITDATLKAKGLIVDYDSRLRVMEQVGKALDQAARQLKNYADGDYTADPKANRFGEFQIEKPKRAALTLSGLFDAWEKEATHLRRANATINRYRSVFANLRAFLKHNDAANVTSEDLVRFKDARLAEGISGKTIKDGDLAALKSVFGWAVENKRLLKNPAADVTIRAAKQTREREKGYTDEEAMELLRTALNYKEAPKESVHLAAAKRWVPWLCAFTGARITEVTALRKEDFRADGEGMVVRLFATKTSAYRDVPLHSQLAEIGFVAFLKASTPGPLFHAKDLTERAAQSQSEKMAKWIRSLGTDKRVKPNHGWRDRFTTVARSVGMDYEKREYILGHVLPGLGSVYGDMAGLRREIDKLPSYEIKAAT